MSFDQTDFVSILDIVKKLSDQIQPNVLDALSTVAMLDARASLIDARIWMIVGVVVFAACLIMWLWGVIKRSPVCSFFGFLGLCTAITIFVFFLSFLLSPLNQAAARDGNIALAKMAMERIMEQDSK